MSHPRVYEYTQPRDEREENAWERKVERDREAFISRIVHASERNGYKLFSHMHIELGVLILVQLKSASFAGPVGESK